MLQQKRPLWFYVFAVTVVWMLILLGFGQLDPVRLRTVAAVCGGFWIGMLAMYIAVHVYRWK